MVVLMTTHPTAICLRVYDSSVETFEPNQQQPEP